MPEPGNQSFDSRRWPFQLCVSDLKKMVVSECLAIRFTGSGSPAHLPQDLAGYASAWHDRVPISVCCQGTIVTLSHCSTNVQIQLSPCSLTSFRMLLSA